MTAELVAIRLREVGSLAASIYIKNYDKLQARQDLTEEITEKIHTFKHQKEITT